MDWQNRAKSLAEIAFKECFDVRFGVEDLVGEGAVWIWNNNPPKTMLVRERQLEALRNWLQLRGFSELGFSVWPLGGVNDGYSYSMIIEADPFFISEIETQIHEIFAFEGWET